MIVHRSSFITVVILSSALAAVSACGGGTPPPETAPAPSAPAAPIAPETAPSASAAPEASAPPASSAAPAPSASAAAEPAKSGWDAKTVDEKREVMKTVVLPTMKTLLHDFDAKRFADVKCTTCHGKGAKDGTFKMPNPDLPKLDFTGGFAKHLKKDPKITKFMMEHMLPEMAKIIGEPVYDPATKKGFGCAECHTMEGK